MGEFSLREIAFTAAAAAFTARYNDAARSTNAGAALFTRPASTNVVVREIRCYEVRQRNGEYMFMLSLSPFNILWRWRLRRQAPP